MSAAVTLQAPLKRGETTIGFVALRRPRAGELRGIKLLDLIQLDPGAVMTLLPRISDPVLTSAEADGLDPADLMAFAAEIATFLVPKAETTDSPQ